MKKIAFTFCFVTIVVFSISAQMAPEGFKSIFNGSDFSGWVVPEGDNGHWKIIDGVIDYDAESEAEGNKSLMSEKKYEDFVLLT
jgi:hypothetical protein